MGVIAPQPVKKSDKDTPIKSPELRKKRESSPRNLAQKLVYETGLKGRERKAARVVG